MKTKPFVISSNQDQASLNRKRQQKVHEAVDDMLRSKDNESFGTAFKELCRIDGQPDLKTVRYRSLVMSPYIAVPDDS